MLRSTLLGIAIQLVSVSSGEVQANDHSVYADISRSGRLVAFHSLATNLSGRTRGTYPQHVYLRDRRRGRTAHREPGLARADQQHGGLDAVDLAERPVRRLVFDLDQPREAGQA